jgi:Na+/H+-translocating membrane pyrophosphatase
MRDPNKQADGLDPATAIYRDMVGSAVQAHGRSDRELVEEIRRKYADKPDVMELCRRYRAPSVNKW